MLIARHEIGHAVMALVCRQELNEVSLKGMDSPIGTNRYLGFTKLKEAEPKPKLTIDLADRKVMISLGGYASEVLFFGSANINSDDLDKAIELVKDMLQVDDFKKVVAKLSPPQPSVLDFIDDLMVKTFIDHKMQTAIQVLAPLKFVIHSLAEELCKRDVLTGDEVTALFNSLTKPNLKNF